MYQSLYRKYRPQNFDEIYGQETAKKILTNSLNRNKISHAYLFFGPRGTGKTSIAKMFARVCNCDHIENGKCCEKCEYCIESADKNCVDIIEIDAASNNGVDEIRDLKNKINLVPNKLKYKVYIIDELHMLSTGAFNALLKTLEEPPSHVIFILATTEYYKMPSTIVSRCQTIEFKNIDELSIYNRLKDISKKEKINIDDDALKEISSSSNGGMRDAIGLLDKAYSYYDGKISISKNNIKEIFGTVSEEEIKELFNLIKKNNIKDSIKKIDEYAARGKDLIKILNDITCYALDIVLIEDNYDILDMIKIMDEYGIRMKNSINPKVVFKMMLAELYNRTNVRNNLNNNIELENKKAENNILNDTKINIRINNSFANADKKLLLNIKEKWKKLNDYTFDVTNGSLVCDLLDCTPVVSSKTNLLLSVNYDSLENKINSKLELYEKTVSDKLGVNQSIAVVNEKKWDALKIEYLNNLKNNIKYEYIDPKDKKIDDMTESIENDETEKKAIDLFGDLLDK